MNYDFNRFAFLPPLLLPLLLGVLSAHGQEEPLRVMSFNIRYGSADDGDNSWPHRAEAVKQTIADYAPHVLGLQEALRFQIDELREKFPSYDEVGVGRDDGKQKGEYAAILVDRRRLEIVDQGTFWFSETPEVVASTSWGNEIPRIATWSRLTDRAADREFYVYNVHWDHVSQNSRERSARLLLNRIAGVDATAIIVTGDFNANEQNAAFRALVTSDVAALQDTYRQLHRDADSVGTFHGFRGGRRGGKIDAVLATDAWKTVDARIVDDAPAGRYPSDHYPVTATLRWVR